MIDIENEHLDLKFGEDLRCIATEERDRLANERINLARVSPIYKQILRDCLSSAEKGDSEIRYVVENTPTDTEKYHFIRDYHTAFHCLGIETTCTMYKDVILRWGYVSNEPIYRAVEL